MSIEEDWKYLCLRVATDCFINGPGGKFIVVRVTKGDEAKRIIWATGLCNHVSLVEECEVRLGNKFDANIEVLGGGEIRANHKTLTYYLWGESPEYGAEIDREQTIAYMNEQIIGWSAIGTEPPEGTFDYYLEACRENRARQKLGSKS